MDYAAWADYIERHFRRRGLPGKTVLDLACGTGSLTRELARRGYEMIGVDLSPEMLAQAAEKTGRDAPIAPIFLCQPMEKLDLYGTIDACVCCLDSVNYVTDPKKLERAFERVHLFLMPGGLFLFDVNTPEKLAAWTARCFWTRRRTPTACGGRSTPGAAGSAPISWTFSSWTKIRPVGARRGAAPGAGLHRGGADRNAAPGGLSGYQGIRRLKDARPRAGGAADLFCGKKGRLRLWLTKS